MKQYGMNQATEFSTKQIGVVYRAAKNQDLRIEKWYINRMYDLADFYGIDENGSVASEEGTIKRILEAVFAKDYTKAQALIDDEQDHIFNLFTAKKQKAIDRSKMA